MEHQKLFNCGLKLPIVFPCDGEEIYNLLGFLTKTVVFPSGSIKEPIEPSKKTKKLDAFACIDVWEILESSMYVIYSPLQLGKTLHREDDEVCFAVLNYIQEEYEASPSDFLSAKEWRQHKSQKTIPKWVNWKSASERYSDLSHYISEKQFDNWLFTRQAQQQKNMLLNALDESIDTKQDVINTLSENKKRKM